MSSGKTCENANKVEAVYLQMEPKGQIERLLAVFDQSLRFGCLRIRYGFALLCDATLGGANRASRSLGAHAERRRSHPGCARTALLLASYGDA